MKNESEELKKIEAASNELVSDSSVAEEEESTEWEAKVMGVSPHTCSFCGEEVGRSFRRCGLCGTLLH